MFGSDTVVPEAAEIQEAPPYEVSTIIGAGASPAAESMVAGQDGYYLSQAVPCGMFNIFHWDCGMRVFGAQIRKYSFDGTEQTTQGFPVTSLAAPLGLVLEGDSLYSTDATKVVQIALADGTIKKTFAVGDAGVHAANGLCINEDKTELYVTDPGQVANMTFVGSEPAYNGFAKINLQTGEVTQIFAGEQGESPNGCIVVGDTVWITNFFHGLSSYNTKTGNFYGTSHYSNFTNALSSVEDTEVAHTEYHLGFVGDGIVEYDTSLYLGLNGQVEREGELWTCPISGENEIQTCVKVATHGEVMPPCADMELDLVSPKAPSLMCPGLGAGGVARISLK